MGASPNRVFEKSKRFILGLGLLCLAVAPSAAEDLNVDGLVSSEVGSFPKNWKTYPFHYGKAEKVYKVAQDGGRRMLRAEDSEDISVPIFKDFNWDIAKYPYLKYRWRAQKIPAGSRETTSATNDSACAVYVGFGRTSALKYVWSASLTEGSYWAKNPGKFYIISKQTGSGSLGSWVDETVSVAEDYQKYFGRPLEKKPSGIGVMTDGNATHQPAACDYADFRISSTP
ncbi:MAG: DUF3047 domain-containing protein [bacterium]